MTRRMSCSMTVDAVKAHTKTVTRRHVDTWRDLKPGDRLTLIEKGMGLAKGAKQVVLAEVEVVDVRVERIGVVDRVEAAAEGFPDMTPLTFATFWLQSHGYGKPTDLPGLDTLCRRIEWRYLTVVELMDNLEQSVAAAKATRLRSIGGTP